MTSLKDIKRMSPEELRIATLAADAAERDRLARRSVRIARNLENKLAAEKKRAAKKAAARKKVFVTRPAEQKILVQIGFNPSDPINRAGAHDHQLRLRYQED